MAVVTNLLQKEVHLQIIKINIIASVTYVIPCCHGWTFVSPDSLLEVGGTGAMGPKKCQRNK